MAFTVQAARRRASLGVSAVGSSFATLGSWAVFSGQVMVGVVVDVIGRAKFLRVVVREIGNIIAGSGIIAVGAGMVFVVAVISLSVGAEVGLQAFKGLQVIGAQSFTGLVGSFVNVREIAPIIYAIALAAQVGAGFTAELGAMRISDEIDALEVMGVPSVTYLVCTRVVAMIITFLPLYLIGLFATFLATRLITVRLDGLSPGIYDYYFHLYLPPRDIFFSVIKVFIFTILITLIHCYYGYTAGGGPVGVGVAVGKAIRVTIVVIVLVNLLLSFVFWGHGATVSVTG
ncbi:MAG TPA: ABC transporter permease [Acidimicrobiales bacterium]|jgi:phospholipid/cholesterol/gamma-HCH transport system permease protein